MKPLVVTAILVAAHILCAAGGVTYIGVSHRTLTRERAAQLGLGPASGSEIVGLDPDGPAARAGLQVEDVVIGVNNLAVDDAPQLTSYIQHLPSRTRITLTVVRNNRRMAVNVLTGSRLIEPDHSAGPLPPTSDSIPLSPAYVGVRARSLTPERALELHVSPVRGAEITTVEEDSPASRAGVRIGDVVLAYETAGIKDATDLQNFIRHTPAGASVRIGAMRDGQQIVLPIQTVVRNDATVPSPAISSSILGCLQGAGIVMTAELGFTALVCGAEMVLAGENALCDALLDAVMNDAPGRAIKACMAGTNIPALSAK